MEEKFIINKKTRYFILDEVRGLCIFCMIFYHAFYTMSFLFNIKVGSYLFYFFKPLEPFFAGTFILISGLCCNFSHSNLIRGIKLLGVALTLSIVTYFIGKDIFISFGILHMLSICMILYGIFEPFIKRFKPIPSIIISSILYIITIPIQAGFIGIDGICEIHIPKKLYNIDFLFPFGIYNYKFYSADYFPLFPWMFIFFFGAFCGAYFLKKQSIDNQLKIQQKNFLDKLLYKNYTPFFSFMGRNSLLIYLVHQPVIYGILYIAGLIIKQ